AQELLRELARRVRVVGVLEQGRRGADVGLARFERDRHGHAQLVLEPRFHAASACAGASSVSMSRALSRTISMPSSIDVAPRMQAASTLALVEGTGFTALHSSATTCDTTSTT